VRNRPFNPLGLVGATLALLAAPAWSLNILLANDDSCNAEGVNVMADALEAAGHTVVMYAPAGEQSGKSSSISTDVGTAYLIDNVGFEGPTSGENRHCVRIPVESPEEGSEETIIASASPWDSVQVGLAVLGDKKPDLVVSGINSSQNIGNRAINSGTIGGAMSALRQDLPGIAISRHYSSPEYQTAADFLVSVIAELESGRAQGEPLLPSRTGLNINVPAETPRGVAHTTLGDASDLNLGHTAEDGEVKLVFDGFVTLTDLIGEEAAAELENNPDATVEDFAEAGLDVNDETSMFVAGYITITTLDGDLTGTRRKREQMQVQLRGLQ
jgi:5'-nucleotidase